MNKNLKKVISAVAALALSVSSFAALTVSAANYPDVPADASYKHAVDELTALDVLVGDENGNFLPDKEVTRAEFAVMLVGALGPAKVRAALAAADQTTPFADVNDVGTGKNHYATGYIMALTGDGTISGYDDGTFKPDNTVSYVEAMKMLTCAAGYDTWAVSKGGWPNGYLSQGNDLGIGDGVTGVGNNDALTRAQCAQMVDNAIKVPVLVYTGKTNYDGSLETEQKNGNGKAYQTILTRNHKAYEVYGRVIETSKTASGGMNADEVRFQVERATNFEDEYFPRNAVPTDFVAKVGDTDASDQLKVYSEAIVRTNDSDSSYELICLSPLSENAEVTFKADDFDEENRYYANAGGDYASTCRLYAYVNGSTRTTSYKLATTSDGVLDNINLYVNGVDVTGTYDLNSFINAFIVDNTVGDVTLVSESSVGSTATSGSYNTIMVTKYYDAIVDSVEERGDYVDIYFKEYDSDLQTTGRLTVDRSDEDTDYSIIKSGVKIAPTDVKPYDVLSMAYDVTGAFADSSFYDVRVSDHDIYEGKYSQVRTKEGLEYQIDGQWYDAAGTMPRIGVGTANVDDRFNTYTFYFDYFGRVAYAEEGSSDKNIAIVDNYYRSSDKETWYVRLIFKDGTSSPLAISSSLEKATYDINGDGTNEADVSTYINSLLYSSGTTKKNPWERVVTYRTNSSNELTAIDSMGAGAGGSLLTYREATNKLGGYTLSEATSAVVVSEQGNGWDIASLNLSTLMDDEQYQAWFFDRSSSSGVYGFAIVKDDSRSFSKSTRMAVYMSVSTTSNENYENALELFTPDSDTSVQVNVSTDYVPLEGCLTYDQVVHGNIAEGTPVVYTVDSAGAITSLKPVMTVFNNYSNLMTACQTTDDLSKVVGLIDYSNKDTETSYDKQYSLIFGLIAMKSGNSVDFVTKYGTTEITNSDGSKSTVYAADTINGIKTCTMSDDTAVYVYDYNGRSSRGDLVVKGTNGSVRDTQVPSRAWADDNNSLINMNYPSLSPRYAVARLLGDDIMEIMVFVPENF